MQICINEVPKMSSWSLLSRSKNKLRYSYPIKTTDKIEQRKNILYDHIKRFAVDFLKGY